MGRLIDADAFERKVMCGDEEDVQDVIYSLRDFPTAYDVDKVVKQLEEETVVAADCVGNGFDCIPTYRATEIVKGGGAQ